MTLLLIKNEYEAESRAFGAAGHAYMNWAAKMAVGLGTGVPWVMCKQNDAPDLVINICNGFHFDYFSPNKHYKPTMWTEAWTGWFSAYESPVHQRPVEDLAFTVARFIQKGGSFVNYYMLAYLSFTGTQLACGSILHQPCVSNSSIPASTKKSKFEFVITGASGGAFALLLLGAIFVYHRVHKIEHDLFVDVAGQGGFGKVYKGILTDNTKVAIKRLTDYQSPGVEAAFLREVQLISVAVHRNLLRLIGFCTTSCERILVYPFMQNLSITYCLRGEKSLDWPTPKRVALGAAHGLEYLHELCNPKIIQRDLKATNILLDDEFEPVLGDFGLAKLVDTRLTHITTQVRGTMGHIAPEYLSI